MTDRAPSAAVSGRARGRPPLLEVIACSVDDALAAEAGGADRLEVVRELDRGGLTPAADLVRAIVQRVHVPVRVMIREQEPFVVTDRAVARATCEAARRMGQLPIAGLVLGFLDGRDRVDEALLAQVLAEAPHLPATFHRAFEEVVDAAEACDALRRHAAIDRILVSGGTGEWRGRLEHLQRLAALAGPGLRILAAAGQDRELIAAVAADPGLGEVHVGRAAREPETVNGPVSATKVRALEAVLHGT